MVVDCLIAPFHVPDHLKGEELAYMCSHASFVSEKAC